MENEQKQALITGGADGIGKQTALELARRGYSVVVAGRNMEKCLAAVKEIRFATKNESVKALWLDLADLNSVQSAAAKFRSRNKQLHALINNAGIFTTSLKKTAQGFELQFGVNHLGHFLFTLLLLNELKAAKEPRVINLTSNAHYRARIDYDNLQGEKPFYQPYKSYGQSKLANVLFTLEFASRFPGIACNAVHPGSVKTRIANKSGWLYSLGWNAIKPFLISVERGAETSVRLASEPQFAGVSGAYFDQRKGQRKPARLTRDPQLASRLWEWSLMAAKEFIPEELTQGLPTGSRP